MHEVLHIIGLCPDSFGHLTLIDIFINIYEYIPYGFKKTYQFFIGKEG